MESGILSMAHFWAGMVIITWEGREGGFGAIYLSIHISESIYIMDVVQ